MTHVTCRLTAKNRSQLGNRVWATFLDTEQNYVTVALCMYILTGYMCTHEALLSELYTLCCQLVVTRRHGGRRILSAPFRRPSDEYLFLAIVSRVRAFRCHDNDAGHLVKLVLRHSAVLP